MALTVELISIIPDFNVEGPLGRFPTVSEDLLLNMSHFMLLISAKGRKENEKDEWLPEFVDIVLNCGVIHH